jgi:cold shock CspA family protein
MEKETGIVKVYGPRKGYGYIQRENGSDIFFSINDVVGVAVLRKDTNVEYDLSHGSSGLCAVNIKIAPEKAET